MKLSTKAKWIGLFASWVMRVWLFTVRFRLIDRADVRRQPNPEKPLLWTFWHNRLFVMAYMWERYFPGRAGAALASASKDGEIISAVMGRFGIRGIRGSSSRRGAAALIEMRRAIEAGDIMALTPDGPRGPRYHMNPGIIKLAQVTGGSILPLHVHFSSFWQLKSWDGFRIPKPFSTIEVTFGPLHHVPKTDSDEEFEAERLRFERVLQAPDLAPAPSAPASVGTPP